MFTSAAQITLCILYLTLSSNALINENFSMNKLSTSHADATNLKLSLDAYTQEWLDSCIARNGSQAMEDIQTSVTELKTCISSRLDIHLILEEIKAAVPRGTLDEVFTKYCDQIPAVKECRSPVITALKVCLSDESDNDLDILDATIDAALDFLCYKGGERIAKNGTDCVTENVDNIANCLNGTLPELREALLELQNVNSSFFDEKNCPIELKMRECFVDSLKDCPDPTPANIVEGLINAMIRKTPCFSNISAKLGARNHFVWFAVFVILSSYIFRKHTI